MGLTPLTMKEKIAVLLGGQSSEREISIKSGTAVYEALLSLGLDVICIDVSGDPTGQIRQAKAGVVFIALHGRFGEDGTIQAVLEKEKMPYTGSGPKASRLCMDKLASRRIFENAGLPVPEYIAIKKRNRARFLALCCKHRKTIPKIGVCPPFSLPVVVKPNREGSSIGMSIVGDTKDLAKAINEAFSYDDNILVEKFIDGEDITVGILDDKPLPVVHIKPKYGVYDYTAKYTDGMSEYVVPAELEGRIIKEAQDLGLKAHNLLGCRCFSRVDMRLGKDKKIRVLEVNSIPGLTANSLLPKAAKAAGIDFAHMCLKMVKNGARKATPDTTDGNNL